MIAHVQLEHYRLQRLIIEFNEQWLDLEIQEPETTEAYILTPGFDVYESGGPDSFGVMLSIDCAPARNHQPARFDCIAVTVWGIFALSEEAPEEHKTQLSWYNPIAMLHGIARGTILHATGTCVGGPFVLPAINYIELIREKLEEATADREPEGATPAAETPNAEA